LSPKFQVKKKDGHLKDKKTTEDDVKGVKGGVFKA